MWFFYTCCRGSMSRFFEFPAWLAQNLTFSQSINTFFLPARQCKHAAVAACVPFLVTLGIFYIPSGYIVHTCCAPHMNILLRGSMCTFGLLLLAYFPLSGMIFTKPCTHDAPLSLVDSTSCGSMCALVRRETIGNLLNRPEMIKKTIIHMLLRQHVCTSQGKTMKTLLNRPEMIEKVHVCTIQQVKKFINRLGKCQTLGKLGWKFKKSTHAAAAA